VSTWVQLCGRFAVEVRRERVDGRLPGRLGRLLLAYLVVNNDRSLTRDELAFALWGDELPPDPEGGLNALLSKVRRAVGSDRIIGRGELRFVTDDETYVDMHYALDALHRAEAHAAAGRCHEGWQPSHTAYAIARRQLLVGHDAAWIDDWRRRLDDVATRALECHVRCYLAIAGSDLRAAESAARALVDRAPFRESGYALLMQVLAGEGNQAEALRIHDWLSRLLRDELGVLPGREVNRVRDQLLGVHSAT
jgi:DNA-binding SARP family transcriptional activator